MSRLERILFWDVDTQFDFMHPEGSLYVPGAERLLENLGRLSQAADRHRIPLVASADNHSSDDAEISDQPDFSLTFPPHCMSGSSGAERVEETRQEWTLVLGAERLERPEIESLLGESQPRVLIQKNELDVFSNPNTNTVLEVLAPERVIVYGVATDFCNRCAVEGLLDREIKVTVVTDAIEAIDRQQAEALLADWHERGVLLRTTDELLSELTTPERASV